MMEAGLFQDLAFTVSLTLIVYFILSKLLSVFAEDVTNAPSNSRIVDDKTGLLEHVGVKYPGRMFDIGDERNNGAVGVVVEENILLVQELKDTAGVGGGQDVKGKVVDEPSPIPQEIEEQLESQFEEACVELSFKKELEDEAAGKEKGRDAGHNTGNREEGIESDDQVGVEEGRPEDDGWLLDDWEGIERSELEKRFDAAVAFVGSSKSKWGIHNHAGHPSIIIIIDANTRMQLYALHRVAVEGPCHVPKPMPFRVSARAKWNAWRKAGNMMSSEMAMEQYMALLSAIAPGWEDTQ